jgi:hypothetical protein
MKHYDRNQFLARPAILPFMESAAAMNETLPAQSSTKRAAKEIP